MSAGILTPTEADELISILRQSISKASSADEFRPAVSFVGTKPGASGLDISGPAQCLQSVHQILAAEAAAFGSLPPCPPTIRARVSMLVVRFINRLVWWQTAVSRRFATAVSELAQKQLDEQSKQGQAVADLETRVRTVERNMQELHRDNAESRVIARFESRFTSMGEEFDSYRRHIAEVEQQARFTNQRISGIESATQFTNHRLITNENMLNAASADIQKLWAGLAAEMGAREATDRRVTMISSMTRDATAPGENSARSQLDDHFYVELQERFRGSRDQIQQRQRTYVPILREAGLGTDDMPILDLGCGRGEWLELLKAEGLKSTGVDSNQDMLAMCMSRDLQVAHADSVAYLSELRDATLGAITSFHMIEHLPFDMLITLIDNALRVLKPGGLLILETPNPRNILVSTHSFYLDPTHLKPIPSELLWFFLEMRGFRNLRRIELNSPKGSRTLDTNPELVEHFRAPLDYCIIGERH